METPLVSISCLVYNHEPFLRECFEGFMMQKTNFPFEVLVHDDASTDKSAEIIREYTAKYPDIFKPIYQTENQYSKGVKVSATFNFPRAKGKYIALCEGDDYWTDPLKLQKQVDFLENNPDHVMCSHRFMVYNQNDKTLKKDWLPFSEKENFHYDLEYFIQRKEWVTQPLTILFRTSALDVEHYSLYAKSKDVTLMYSLLRKGKGVMLKDMMGVYRIHSGGIWLGATKASQIKAEGETSLGIYEVEKDKISATLLKNSIEAFGGYLGVSFFKANIILYIRILCVMYKEFGFETGFNFMCKTCNYFRR